MAEECKACGAHTYENGRCTREECGHRELPPSEVVAAQQELIVQLQEEFIQPQVTAQREMAGARNALLFVIYALMERAVNLAYTNGIELDTLFQLVRITYATAEETSRGKGPPS